MPPARSLGLASRYLLVIALTSLAAAIVVSFSLRGGLREQALQEDFRTSRDIVSSTVAAVLDPEDFSGAVSSDRRRLLQALLAAALEDQPGVHSATLHGRDGTVLFASPPDVEPEHAAVMEAVAGDATTTFIEHEGRRSRLSNFPIRFAGGRVEGVIQVRSTTEQVDRMADEAAGRILRNVLGVVASIQVLALPLLVGAARRLRRKDLELEASAREYETLATHDPLTGLPNRVLFDDRLGQTIAHAARSGERIAVVVLDLDDFHSINDTLGHGAGDAVIAAVGPRLAQVLREGDSVARFGGDEFVLLLRQAEDEIAIRNVVRRALDALAQPVVVEDVALAVGGSAGLAVFPRDGRDAADLLRRAEVALRVAKVSHERLRFFDVLMDAGTRDQLTVLTDLRRALREGDLRLAYQPILALSDERVVGHEALLRWKHPDKGDISPAIFVAAAERTGLVHELTSHVLWEGLAALAMTDLGRDGRYLSVNVSARDVVGDELFDVVRACLNAHQLPGSALQLEVTETVAMSDPFRAIATLERITALGVSVVIDDYGTGHSSLAYLQQLPVRALKIDRGFIANLTRDAADATIVRSTIELAHNLGLSAVAEGVEDAETSDRLREMGCDLVQGFHHGRPVPLDQAVEAQGVAQRRLA